MEESLIPPSFLEQAGSISCYVFCLLLLLLLLPVETGLTM